MSKNVAVFVDVANLYYSARGQEVDVDYVALLKAATKGRDLIRAYAYSGLDPENENQRKFIDFLFKNGYKVVHKDIRKFGDGRVKANLDIELVVDLFRLANRMDIAVIVSGDGDFAPAIRALQDKGVRCEVISFRPNTSSDLIAVADEFIDIMKIIGIGRGKKDDKPSKVMSAPPMPAKEVVPEFGFREASPSVAAAALAALRDGKAPRTGSTRGRGRGRSRVAAADSEEAPVAAASANGSDRGRDRRERGEPPPPSPAWRPRPWSWSSMPRATGAAPEPNGEIGWTELDDISQLEELATAPATRRARSASTPSRRPMRPPSPSSACWTSGGACRDGRRRAGNRDEAGAAPAKPEARSVRRRGWRRRCCRSRCWRRDDRPAQGPIAQGVSHRRPGCAGREVAEKPARRTRAPKTTGTRPSRRPPRLDRCCGGG